MVLVYVVLHYINIYINIYNYIIYIPNKKINAGVIHTIFIQFSKISLNLFICN